MVRAPLPMNEAQLACVRIDVSHMKHGSLCGMYRRPVGPIQLERYEFSMNGFRISGVNEDGDILVKCVQGPKRSL